MFLLTQVSCDFYQCFASVWATKQQHNQLPSLIVVLPVVLHLQVGHLKAVVMVGCSGCRYDEEPPLLVELVQQCSDRPDPNVNVHGCSIQNKKPLDMTQRMGLTAFIICFFLSVSDIQQRYVKYGIFLINEKRNIFFSAELYTWNATQITELKKSLKWSSDQLLAEYVKLILAMCKITMHELATS